MCSMYSGGSCFESRVGRHLSFRGFLQVLQASVGILPTLVHERLLSNSFQFIINPLKPSDNYMCPHALVHFLADKEPCQLLK
jgi:hypothetical protein